MLQRKVLLVLFALGCCWCVELPQGWTAHVWQGKTYYHNRQTGASQWERPTALAAQVQDLTAQQQQPQPQSQQPQQHGADLGSELARAIAERDSALHSKQEAVDLYSQLQARLNTTLQARTVLQSRLDEASQENRQLQLRMTDTREQLIAAQQKVTHLSETVSTLRRMVKDADANATVIESHLQQAMGRIEQQERELAGTYKEIEKLDRRLRDLARSRARSSFPSFLPRAIRRWLPFKPTRAFRTATLMDEIEGRLNRTIRVLRQNNTALAHALHTKTAAVNEMQVRASQSEERAEQATKAHTALREQLDLLVGKLAERDKQNEAYEVAVSALQQELNEVRANETRHAKTEQQLQARRTTLSNEHEDLKHKYEQLQDTLDGKNRMIEALNSTATSLQQSLLNLRHQLSTTTQELVHARQSGTSTWSRLRRSRWLSWCFLGLL